MEIGARWCRATGLVLGFAFALVLSSAPAGAAAVDAASDAGGDAKQQDTATVVEDEPGPLTERVAEFTRGLAEETFSEVMTAAQALDPRGKAVDWPSIAAAAGELAVVVVPTILLFALLRWLENPLFSRLAAWCARGTTYVRMGRQCVAAVGRVLSDFGGILLAWVGGYALALFVVGEPGTMDTRQSLFLNAFLGLEALKALLRLLLAPRHPGLRLLPLGAADAAYWNAWLARLIDYVGYGLLVVVPIVSEAVSPAVGSVIGFLVLATGLFYGITIIRQNRERVRSRLRGMAQTSGVAFNRFALALLGRIWHILAIAYLVVLAVVIQLRPEQALAIMGAATLQTLVITGLGLAIYYALSTALGRPLQVPRSTRERLPDLEERLNQFVAPAIHVLRAVVLVLIALGLIDAWHLVDVPAWLASSTGIRTLATALSVVLILVFVGAFWIFAASWIDAHLRLDGDNSRDIGARKRTLLSLFRSALAIVLAVLTIMVVLSELGINIAPLLAGAGVIGLAIGFGAQKLVQDIITGVFIQLENAMNTGDWVTVGGISGSVERLNIRSVGIRDLEGAFHIIPFSFVDTVSNYMREFAYHLGNYGVAYRENTDEVIQHLQAAYTDLLEDPDVAPYILSELHVDGVSALADSAVNIRIRIKTVAGMQWFVGRAYNRLVKQHFDAAGIEIPFPHQTVYFGHNKDGSAPPLVLQTIASDSVPAEADRQPERAARGQKQDPANAGADELPAEFGDVERDHDPRNVQPGQEDESAPAGDDDSAAGSGAAERDDDPRKKPGAAADPNASKDE